MSLDRSSLLRRAIGSALLVSIVLPNLAHADVEDYERGVRLLEESRQQREFDRRNQLLGKAQDAFRQFLNDSPDHPSTRSARTQMGSIFVERARMQLELARNTNGESKGEARRLYEQAYEIFEKAQAGLSAELSNLRHVDSADREKLAQRDKLRSEYLQAQLLKAAVLEESADTHESHDAKRQDILAKAADEYQEIFEKYRSRLAGLYARFYQSRCLKKCGKCKEALECLEDVFDVPDAPAPFSPIKTKALNLALECWLDDSQKDYRQAMDRGNEWLKKHGEQNPESRECLELRFHLARAHQLFAESTNDAKLRTIHRQKARTLAEFVVRREGTFQAEAKKLLGEIGDDNTAAESLEPKSFAEAKAAGKAVMDEIQAIRLELAKQGIPAVAGDIASELEPLNAGPAPKPDPLKLKLKRKQAEAIRYYQLALKLADDQTPADDIDVLRYFLCYLYYSDEAYDKAIELGEDVARNRPTATGARQCAKIVLASYMKIYQSQSPEDRKASGEAKRLMALGDYILETWPDDSLAVEALDMLVPLSLSEDRHDDAVAYLKKMPADSPRRIRNALRLGVALWTNYLQGIQRLRTWKRDGGPPPGTDREAMAKQVAKTREQAEAILSDAIKGARDAESVTQEVLTAALSLVHVHLESGQLQQAVDLLEDPRIGPLRLLENEHPAAKRSSLASEIYKTAIRAYEAVGDNARAERLRKSLEELGDDDVEE